MPRSILFLIGLDTDTDAIRVHLPDGEGDLSLDRYVDALELYHDTRSMSAGDAASAVTTALAGAAPESAPGMQQLVARLIENNISQIVYVKNAHGEHYPDIGHAERFIGAGVGFEEIQLRNLMYFAYLNTVEEATPDTDVGIKIFKGLNVARGLPVPVVVRFDYHSKVPGARDRAVERMRPRGRGIESALCGPGGKRVAAHSATGEGLQHRLGCRGAGVLRRRRCRSGGALNEDMSG